MKAKLVSITTFLLILGLLIVGCGDQMKNPVTDSDVLSPETQETVLAAPAWLTAWWRQLPETEKNQRILNEAERWLGDDGGQCKKWVRTVVENASRDVATIPSTFESPNHTYHWAKWTREYPSSDAQVVLRGTSNPCIYWWKFKPGQIIQMRHNAGGVTPHTMIIKVRLPWGFRVIDSNWNKDEKVCSHWIPGSWIRNHVEAWTVYQMK